MRNELRSPQAWSRDGQEVETIDDVRLWIVTVGSQDYKYYMYQDQKRVLKRPTKGKGARGLTFEFLTTSE